MKIRPMYGGVWLGYNVLWDKSGGRKKEILKRYRPISQAGVDGGAAQPGDIHPAGHATCEGG